MTMKDKRQPIEKNEDVEFTISRADNDDLEALDRAEAADQRVKEKNN